MCIIILLECSLTRGYLHFSEGSVLHGEVSGEVIREVVGVTRRMGGTHRTYHFLEHARIRMLLGHMISKPHLRESDLSAEGAGEGSGVLCTVIFPTEIEI